MLADSVGLALLVVLDTLTPAERLAFVLHDMFAVPFQEIGPIIGRSPEAARMLASRARRRVRTADVPDANLRRQREVVDAFLAASRNGDFAALLNVLDPDVTARADAFAAPPGAPTRLRGARAVAEQALVFSYRATDAHIGLVNGAPAIMVTPHGRLAMVMTFTITNGKIVTIDVIADPQRLAQLTTEST
jgi:RNA polymerase sigma-70 factor (ECF subfamily)